MSAINCLQPKSEEEGLWVQFIILLTNPVGTCKQLCCGFNVYLVLKYLNYFDFHSPLSQILDYGNQDQ